ncbi:hypothetical protein L6452_13169 [Arctium lappa]|uniref:Uncharacterized protein n=1 Tax=Arctium lappa TaxID=4217 RepID=A0ACB9CHG7_ARCLA|nr:hypothetical protein L6452_13169 [Arctium lappa]
MGLTNASCPNRHPPIYIIYPTVITIHTRLIRLQSLHDLSATEFRFLSYTLLSLYDFHLKAVVKASIHSFYLKDLHSQWFPGYILHPMIWI